MVAAMVAAILTAGLAKSFGATAALRPLDLEVPEGEVLGYLGPNGGGVPRRSGACSGLSGLVPGVPRSSAWTPRHVRLRRTDESPTCRVRRTSGQG